MRFVGDTRPNGICDKTGFKVKLDDLVKQYDGAMVRRASVDRRHPQDFVRGVPERQNLPFARPEAPDTFIDPEVNPVLPSDL